MKIITKILVVSLILLFSSGHAVCKDIPFTVLDEIERDAYRLFGTEPKESAVIINKYKDEEYYPISYNCYTVFFLL